MDLISIIADNVALLWHSLKGTDFYAILTLIGILSLSLIKVSIFILKKFGLTVNFNRATSVEQIAAENQTREIQQIAVRVEDTVTVEQLQQSLAVINETLNGIKTQISTLSETIQPNVAAVAALKQDFENFKYALSRDITAFRQDIGSINIQTEQHVKSIKDILYRGHDLMHRVEVQLEKLDELMRTAVPEFRDYHKDLSKEISELSRDIALLERTVQTQGGGAPLTLR